MNSLAIKDILSEIPARVPKGRNSVRDSDSWHMLVVLMYDYKSNLIELDCCVSDK